MAGAQVQLARRGTNSPCSSHMHARPGPGGTGFHLPPPIAHRKQLDLATTALEDAACKGQHTDTVSDSILAGRSLK